MRFRRNSAALLVAVLAITGLVQVANTAPASAYPVSSLTFNGHGYGHGRGMGQYGALGYALDHSWSWQQILDRYYGGTSFGSPSANVTIGVRMTAFDGADLKGIDMIVTSANSFDVAGNAFGAGQATRVRRIGSNNFAIDQGPNCGGPWTEIATKSPSVTVTPANTSPGNDENQMLRLCGPTGIRGVRGTAQAVDIGDAMRTINNLYVEDYLRGVVPRESPASWGDLGGGKGMNALRAQTVAARSYVLAGASYSYATTCDTQACQVYGGAFLNGTYIEDARTNQAIADTAGVVRRLGNGNIARTEFSSSSGGYTAGGTFTAVQDAGDTYSGNPHHDWTTSVNVSSIESAYPTIGSLQSIQVTARNGLGDLGGRVTAVSIAGTNATVSVTGLDVRTKLGLKSDWFEIAGTPSGGVSGYLMLGNDGGIFALGGARFYGSMGGKSLNRPIVGIAQTPTGLGYWEVASDGGVFAFGDARFHGSMGGKSLTRPIVGMAPTPTGNGYWMVASDGGVFAFGDAGFHGSMGGKPLNKPIVGMTATPSGQGYRFVASDGGIFSYGDAGFYGSTGNLTLQKAIVGMQATPSGLGYWLVASDGGIFAYGDAPFKGSLGSAGSGVTISDMARTVDGQGYMLVSTTGRVFSYGSAPNFGDLSSRVSGYSGRISSILATS